MKHVVQNIFANTKLAKCKCIFHLSPTSSQLMFSRIKAKTAHEWKNNIISRHDSQIFYGCGFFFCLLLFFSLCLRLFRRLRAWKSRFSHVAPKAPLSPMERTKREMEKRKKGRQQRAGVWKAIFERGFKKEINNGGEENNMEILLGNTKKG